MILEDNAERIRDFESAMASLGSDFQLRLWHDAPTMVAECLPVLPECCLISLYARIIMMMVPGADDIQLYQPTHKLAYNH